MSNMLFKFIVMFVLSSILFIEPAVAETMRISDYGSWQNENVQVEKEQIYRTASISDQAGKAQTKEELKTIIYEEMKSYNTSFSIAYTGNTSMLKETIASAFQEIFESDQYAYGTLSKYGYSSYGYTN